MAATIPGGFAPDLSARCDAAWMVGPSMTGSENGMPISMASAPDAATAATTSSQPSSPPVTYGTSSLRPASRSDRRRASSGPGSLTSGWPPQDLGHLGDVLVTAPGKVDEH